VGGEVKSGRVCRGVRDPSLLESWVARLSMNSSWGTWSRCDDSCLVLWTLESCGAVVGMCSDRLVLSLVA
jgi:hypothetical protein